MQIPMDQCQHIKLLTCFVFWPKSLIFSATWANLSLLIARASHSALERHFTLGPQEIIGHAVNNGLFN